MELFVSDLDGTLFNSDKVLSSKTIRIINKLTDRGVLFTIATARSLVSAGGFIAPLHLRLPMIFHNGAFIYDPLTGENIVTELISSEDSVQILEIFSSASVNPLVYTIDSEGSYHVYHRRPQNDGEKTYLGDRLKNGDKRFIQVESFEAAEKEKTICIVSIQHESVLDPLVKEIQRRLHVAVHFAEDIYSPGFYWMEICNKTATKEHAVQYVKEYVGAEKLVCFGDHINDLPMFSVADEAYAVSNAHEVIKARADGIIGSNDVDGVAEFLESRMPGSKSEHPRHFSTPVEAAAFITECLRKDDSLKLMNNLKSTLNDMDTRFTNSTRFYHFIFKPLQQLLAADRFSGKIGKTDFTGQMSSYSFSGPEWGLANFRIDFVREGNTWYIKNIEKKSL